MLMMTDEPLKALVADTPVTEVPCMDHWLIAYSRPRAQEAAKFSLEREGYEVWYPVRKIVSKVPQRNLPSKTRHKRRWEVVESFEPVLGCYLLIRQIKESHGSANIYDLNGVGGYCKFGEKFATVRDYEVELLRLAEADGKFNIYHAGVPNTHRATMAVDPRRDFEKKQYDGKPRDLGHGIDRYGESVQFVETLGRVIRQIKSAEPPADL